jgi:hypothetical protein
MQLIEVSEIGVRAGIVRLVSPKAKLEWLMFPMIHLGEHDYYRQVEEKLNTCDLVLAEGVDSRIVSALTRSYRLAADPQANLVVQPDTKAAREHMSIQQSDISGSEFDSAWRKMPLGLRLGVPLLAPLYGLWLRFVADPESWQSKLGVDDLPTNEDVLLEGQFPELTNLVMHRRNQHLFHQIAAVQERWRDEPKVVGVAWGAKHIGAVVQFLNDRWAYFARSAEWVTVFDYTK